MASNAGAAVLYGIATPAGVKRRTGDDRAMLHRDPLNSVSLSQYESYVHFASKCAKLSVRFSVMRGSAAPCCTTAENSVHRR